MTVDTLRPARADQHRIQGAVFPDITVRMIAGTAMMLTASAAATCRLVPTAMRQIRDREVGPLVLRADGWATMTTSWGPSTPRGCFMDTLAIVDASVPAHSSPITRGASCILEMPSARPQMVEGQTAARRTAARQMAARMEGAHATRETQTLLAVARMCLRPPAHR